MVRNGLVVAALLGLIFGVTAPVAAQGRGGGGFVPGQQRPPGDAAQIARGKSLYGINCAGCHGADLRGGDLGGPNLLRSQVALSDRDGELIVPIILGSRQNSGMPAISMSPEDAKTVAAFVRSIEETIGRQGTPPSVGVAALNVVIGNASEGQAYFAAKCSSCHSPTGDLQGIASRISDPKALQNAWVSGFGRGNRGTAMPDIDKCAVTVAIALPGERVEGRLVRIDDFLSRSDWPMEQRAPSAGTARRQKSRSEIR